MDGRLYIYNTVLRLQSETVAGHVEQQKHAAGRMKDP